MTISYSGNVIRLLLRWKGSIWRAVWVELLIYLFFFYAIRLFYRVGIDLIDETVEGKLRIRGMFESFCRQCDSYTKLIPLTFLLGFYVSNVVSRWWRQFETLYWPEDILSVLCTILHQHDESSRRRRHVIAKYLNLSCALAWRDISSKIRLRFPTVHSLIEGGLLTEKEYNILEATHTENDSSLWMTPLHWIQQIIRKVEEDHKPTPSLLNQFVVELKTFRQSLRKLYSYDWVCVPLVYTQVATLATYAFFFFSLFGRQPLIPEVDSGKDFDMRVPIFTIVQFLFFVGWFKVGQDLMRPFGLDDDDIELNYILDRNVRVSFDIVNHLQEAELPDFENDDDRMWDEMHPQLKDGETSPGSKIPQLPHSKYSSLLSEHPPRLHAYVPIDDDRSVLDLENHQGCMPHKKGKKHLNW
uniref:Bestrophin homolog n=2 Tax=Caenorhabditis tropicalis TaxID=1561998 RepID=A0A1I7U9J3_9PELO